MFSNKFIIIIGIIFIVVLTTVLSLFFIHPSSSSKEYIRTLSIPQKPTISISAPMSLYSDEKLSFSYPQTLTVTVLKNTVTIISGTPQTLAPSQATSTSYSLRYTQEKIKNNPLLKNVLITLSQLSLDNIINFGKAKEAKIAQQNKNLLLTHDDQQKFAIVPVYVGIQSTNSPYKKIESYVPTKDFKKILITIQYDDTMEEVRRDVLLIIQSL